MRSRSSPSVSVIILLAVRSIDRFFYRAYGFSTAPATSLILGNRLPEAWLWLVQYDFVVSALFLRLVQYHFAVSAIWHIFYLATT